MKNQKNSIRLTNKTAKNLRRQAVQQKHALYLAAVIMSVALTGAGFVLGMEHIIILPLMLLFVIGMDALILLLAKGRYTSLLGQAICTEAAARQIKAGSAEQARIETAKRDLERIKKDLEMDEAYAEDDEDEAYALHDRDDEDDEDMYSPQRVRREPKPVVVREAPTQPTRPVEQVPVRRRRQARLQVIVSDTPDNKAN